VFMVRILYQMWTFLQYSFKGPFICQMGYLSSKIPVLYSEKGLQILIRTPTMAPPMVSPPCRGGGACMFQ
jgi:hypothetical protein